jgi:hypothetical protein
MSVLMYGAKTWTQSKAYISIITVQARCPRSTEGEVKRHRIRNKKIRFKLNSFEDNQMNNRIRWYEGILD